MKKKQASTGVIDNRRARYDYDVRDVFSAGLSLTGPEVKSLRMGHGHLRGAFVTVKDGEAWLLNATVTPMKTNAAHLGDQTRTRKLLLKKREIDQLIEAKNQGLTIIPLKIRTRGRFIKVDIATAKGKRTYDKRELIKKRDQDRDTARTIS